jgi:RNA polymerase sigma-70 factor (ECF subfamily)
MRRFAVAEDGQLVQAVAAGDMEAVGAVWDRYSSLVRSVIRMRLGSDSETEDVVQEVFIAFLRSAARIRDADSLRAYLLGISTRIVLAEIRRRKIRRWVMLSPNGIVPERIDVATDSSAAETLRGLYHVLERMPARRRDAFVLRHAHGLEISEIAKTLDVSESTVKRDVVNARMSLSRAGRADGTGISA